MLHLATTQGLWLVLAAALLGPGAEARATEVPDTMAQRMVACTVCHGREGRATPSGYFPRIAGKPEGYLHQQLLAFRDGRRQYAPMAHLLAHQSDAYLGEMASYFARLDLPYPPPEATPLSPAERRLGEQLVRKGDPARGIAACAACHGPQLTGVASGIPGLLGLPRDYLRAQLGAWVNGTRQANAPDCMAHVARQLTPADVGAVSGWLASQPVPSPARPLPGVAALGKPLPAVCGSAAPAQAAAATEPRGDDARVERGRYLALVGNCAGCHTAAGGQPYAGGRGIGTPFGTVYAGNLTPDPEHGLGRWTAEQFRRALRQGRSADGRLLAPAFPYTSYTQVNDADADALWAYLRSLAPVAQANRPHELRWPYNTQAALWVWRLMYFKEETFKPEPTQSAAWNRGAYLVRGLGHCAACHAARDGLGGLSGRDARALSGGFMPVQHWYAPSLADPNEAGVQAWSVRDIVALLRDGRVVTPGPGQQAVTHSVVGPMAEVVASSTQHWQADDLLAAATYLKALPLNAAPATAAAPLRAADQQAQQRTLQQGAALYRQHCAQCHGERGEGQRTTAGAAAYPALAGSRAVTSREAANLVQLIASGGFLPSTAGNPRPFGMPPFAHLLSDADMAAVATFIRQSWGHQASAVSALDVLRIREGRY
jgi:mono/diheme cytochrome c family protein